MAVDVESGEETSVLAHYRRLLAFRRAHPALQTGTIRFLDAPEEVLAFVRSGGGEEIVCLFNLGKVDARVTAPAALTPLAGSGFAARPDADGRSVTLGPGEAFFGRLDAARTA